MLKVYLKFGGFEIDIIGHTDAKGSESYNQDLSERRAKRVYDWFLSKGIPASSLSSQGFGESTPIAANELNGADYPDGRARNRRVEITAKTKEKVTSLPQTPKSEKVIVPEPPKKIGPPKVNKVIVPWPPK